MQMMDQNETIKNRKHACERCRRSKVRCLVDTVKEHGKCRRCHQADEECVFELLAPRQQRKRTDTRIVALERQLTQLRNTLDHSRPTPSVACNATSPGHGSSREAQQDYGASQVSRDPSSVQQQASTSYLATPLEADVQNSASFSQPEYEAETIPGCIRSELLPVNVAARLLADFVHRALPEYPVIAVGKDDSFELLRTTKPTLLLAIITAASRATDPVLFNQLHLNLLKILTEKVVMDGEKSLELLQAVLIMEIWYGPPNDLKRLNFYLWTQIAGTMALQLNLWWEACIQTGPASAMPNKQVDISLVNWWRTALVAYLSVSTIAISLRRPRIISFGDDAQATLAAFTENAVHVNDKRLVAWMNLQLIAEAVEDARKYSTSLGYDINNRKSSQIATLQQIEDRFMSFRMSSSVLMNDSLYVHYLYCRGRFYELAMAIHEDPTTSQSLAHPPANPTILAREHVDSVPAAYARAVMNLVRSWHNIIDHLTHMDATTYLNCPTVTTVRALYALKSLLALQTCSNTNPATYGRLLDDEFLSFRQYLDRMEEFLIRIKGTEDHKVPIMALTTIYKIRAHAAPAHNRESSSSPLSSHNKNRNTSQIESENDLEEVTTPTLQKINDGNQETPQPQDTEPYVLDQNVIGGAQYPTSYPHFQYGNPPWASSALSGEQITLTEFDMMSMPEAMGFSNTMFWDSAANPPQTAFSHGWYTGSE